MMAVMAEHPHAMIGETQCAAVACPSAETAAESLGSTITLDIPDLAAVVMDVMDGERIRTRDLARSYMRAVQLPTGAHPSKCYQHRRFDAHHSCHVVASATDLAAKMCGPANYSPPACTVFSGRPLSRPWLVQGVAFLVEADGEWRCAR